MKSRREFLQLAAITSAIIGSRSFNSVAAKQSLSQNELLQFDIYWLECPILENVKSIKDIKNIRNKIQGRTIKIEKL